MPATPARPRPDKTVLGFTPAWVGGADDLRMLVRRGSAAEAAESIRRLGVGGPLQLQGEALLLALRAGVAEAPPLARAVAAALRERSWDGDEELADALDGATGDGAIPMLREVPVDLEELAVQLDSSDLQGWLDPATGTIHLDFDEGVVGEIERDEEEGERDAWIDIPRRSGGWDELARFADAVGGAASDRLQRAIAGKGAFRRFKDEVDRLGLLDLWYAVKNDAERGRGRAWLAEEGLTPKPGHG